MLSYLAMVIDPREERLEKTTIPFLKKQISVELEGLLERFQAQYHDYLVATGQSDPAALLRVAA